MSQENQTRYVVWACERLQDGREEYATIVDSIEEALKVINADRFASNNWSYAVYKLGDVVPIVAEKQEVEEKKVTTKTVFRIANSS